MSPSKFIGLPENFAAHGGSVDVLIDMVQWFMLILFVGWTAFFFVCLYRFSRKRNPKASYHGVKGHLSTHLEIAVIIVEIVLLVGMAIPLWKQRVDTFDVVQAQDPARVRVVGWQFGWTYHYPGADGKFGNIDHRQYSGANSLGIDKYDPNAADDFTSPILKIPVDKPAILMLSSKDVIHNFAIVPMRIQQDAIPGEEYPMWFTPTKVMETFVICGQLCGEGHANMVGTLEVIEQDEYREWAAAQSKNALASK